MTIAKGTNHHVEVQAGVLTSLLLIRNTIARVF